MSFAEPSMLPLLTAPLIAGLLAIVRHRRRLGQQRRLASPGVWNRLMGGVPATGLWRLLAWCAAAAMVVLALARPQWGELPRERSIRTRDLVVALDVSDSMLCPDLRPSRMARSLQVVQRALPSFEGNRVGVVVFAGDAYPLVPLTGDLNAVAAFLEVVRPQMVALPGSNIERAVATALKMLPSEGDGRVVVLMTDGENLQGNTGAAAQALRDAGVGVLAVTAGTGQGGPIPMPDAKGGIQYKRDSNGQPVITRARPDVMAELARAVDGDVLQIEGGQVVDALVERVERLRTRELEATVGIRRIERFQIFLVAAAVLAALGFGVSPWRRLAVVGMVVAGLLVPATGTAQTTPTAGGAAGGGPVAAEQPVPPPVSWWQRLIPGGSRRLARSGSAHWKAGDVGKAVNDFAGAAMLDPESPDRLFDLGTGLAAGGQLETAAPVLRSAHDAGSTDAAYNGGTAALQQQQAEQAVQWLRQALLRNPNDRDAKVNYELALKMLEQQQKQQQQQQQQDDQQDEQQTPTPTPSPEQGGAAPTPTPDPSNAVFAALDRAEAEAREKMRSPTPEAVSVEKDW